MKNSLKIYALIPLFAVGLATMQTACSATATRESTGEYVDDATITTKVKTQLVSDENVKGTQVKVDTFKGVVQLSGFVNTAAEKERAGQIASGIAGVHDVQNNITVK